MASPFEKHICVTGSIGSGKSRVCKSLAALLGLPYIDIDSIARDIMSPGGVGFKAVAAYDASFLDSSGRLNRPRLRKAIFNSVKVKKDIDNLLHPLIQTALRHRLLLSDKRHIIEIPLLFETGWHVFFKTIIVVTASKSLCVQRIVTRDHVTPFEAEKAHDSQMDSSITSGRATFVIENDGDWHHVLIGVENVAHLISKGLN